MKATEIAKMSRKELEKLKGLVEKQISKLEKLDRKAALEAADKVARQHGFSLKELTAGTAPSKQKTRKTKAAGTVNPPKYRNPDNLSQTWTGKGRRPEWIKAAQDKGVDIATMAI